MYSKTREIFTSEKGVVHLPERSERSCKAEGKKDWVTWGNHEMSRECLVGKEETGSAEGPGAPGAQQGREALGAGLWA